MRLLKRRFLKLPQYVPALITLPEEAGDGWGRLLHLSARGLTLLTLTEVRRGGELFLTFDLGGARLERVACRVMRRETDPDGYFVYGLAILRESDAQKMKDRLMELLAKQA